MLSGDGHRSAELVGFGSATQDRGDEHGPGRAVHGKENAITAHAATPAVALAFQLEDIAGKGVVRHCATAAEILAWSLAGNLARCFCAGFATWTVHLMEEFG